VSSYDPRDWEPFNPWLVIAVFAAVALYYLTFQPWRYP